jgi:hypothetical protein
VGRLDRIRGELISLLGGPGRRSVIAPAAVLSATEPQAKDMRNRVRGGLVLAALAALAASCSRGEASSARSARDSAARHYRKQPGYVIDSLLPMDEYMRRFRAGLTEPHDLAAGEPTRDALVRAFITALATRDTAGLNRMTLTKPEFAWLYFPDHAISRPPYELPPDITWLQISLNGNKGRVRLLERLAGQTLQYRGHVCPDSGIRVVGVGREHGRCRVIVDMPNGTRDTLRFFGPIFERGGRFKFVSYANDF